MFEYQNSEQLIIKTPNYNIAFIDSLQTHEVRHPVLRAGKPIESCIFDGDDLLTTIHLGIFSNEKPIGVCSFFKNHHKAILKSHQYQLRGMAVLQAYQGKGLGNLMLRHGENLLIENGTKIVWCNAREIALDFYKKCGYKIIGEPFHIKDIGLHYAMCKPL